MHGEGPDVGGEWREGVREEMLQHLGWGKAEAPARASSVDGEGHPTRGLSTLLQDASLSAHA